MTRRRKSAKMSPAAEARRPSRESDLKRKPDDESPRTARPDPLDPTAKGKHPRRRYQALTLVLISGLAVAAGAYFIRATGKGAPGETADGNGIPILDSRGVEPKVAGLLQDARSKVVARPNSARAWMHFGQACDAHHLYDCAERCYRRAKELSPDDFEPVYLLATILDLQGRSPDETIPVYQSAARLAPRYAPIYFRIGEAHSKTGNLHAARDAYRSALERNPNLAVAHRNLGQILLRMDETDSALQHLQQAATLSPGDGAVLATLAQTYRRLGRFEQADAAVGRARLLTETHGVHDPVRNKVLAMGVSAALAFERGKRLLKTGDFAGAIANLTVAADIHPDDPEVHSALATALVQHREIEAGLARFARAAALAPLPARAHLNWGNALTLQGDSGGAQDHYRKALRLDPAYAQAHYNLGLLLESLGRREEAISHYQQAVSSNPSHPAAQRLREIGAPTESTDERQPKGTPGGE